ncbi:tetratricopeptide repeat protein [Desulfotalea psychrophila]|uniref:Hypothetical membrane protein (BatE) n=1 Tax=Desulfotalea psychrophila (strain LSv54 / DSM 12343) TaxID=177439 RepID=Q6AQK3_DESPS|nr:tetratricopeptide repeat protein [Desulfotalea psychrophila]CAG35370.1 hypothetical membrane protein (BatE) [Desulfotalea psychrophila LSv54]
MKTIVLTLWSLLLLVTAVQARPLDEANRHFAAGEFARAISLYENIEKQEGFSMELLFNQANAYAQLGKTGRAVLYYQRALRLDPGNANIIKNLQLVEKEAGLFSKEENSLKQLISFVGINNWTILSLLLFLPIILVLIFWQKMSRKKALAIICSSVIAMLLSSEATAISYQQWPIYVLVEESRNLLISPFENAASAGLIKEGGMILVHKRYGKYSYIEDKNDQGGWVKSKALRAVILDPAS